MTSQTRLVNTEKLKQEIAEALPVSAVAEQLCDVELYQSGVQQKGRCPIHDEDTPSFYVNDGKGVYHCFGCKEGGDSIDLVRKVRHLEYFEALYLLAAEADVDIERFERPLTEDEKRREELRLYTERWLNECVDRMVNVATFGESRVDDVDLIREFGIGFCEHPPQSPPPGVKEFERRELFDHAVIFPYRTATGQIVGWKSRLEGKKMFGTSAQFPLAEPAFFGLDVARQYVTGGQLIVVEGEYDAIACHAAGIRNVVAVGGSAFTAEHWEIIRNLRIQEVVFMFDADEGGATASAKVADAYWDQKPTVRIAALPDDQDPEDVLRNGGLIVLQEILGKAMHALEWILWVGYRAKPRTELGGKLEFLDWIAERFGKRLQPPLSDLVSIQVAKWLGLPEFQVVDLVRTNESMVHNLQASDSERILMGRCLRDAAYYTTLRKQFVRDDFFVMRHRRLWECLEALLVDNLDFDLTTIKHRAEQMGVDAGYIDGLLSQGESNMAYHEDRVLDMAVRRNARDEADRFRERIADISVDSTGAIGDMTTRVASKALGSRPGLSPISEQVDQAMEVLHERMKNPSAIHGIDFGSQFPELSKTMQGLQPRRLALVAAGSSAGKTTLTAQFAVSMAVHQSVPVDFISLEMDESELLFKLSSHMTGIPGLAITGGALDERQAKLIEQAMARIRKSPLRIYAPDGLTTNEFVLYARESVMERRTEVFVVDYVQLISPDAGMERASGYELYGHFGREAKMRVARAMDTSVLACAQLNRAASEKDRPSKEDMGDSYDLVRHADVILLIKKNQDSANHDLWLDKNRQGPGNKLIPVTFDEPAQTFREQKGAAVPDYRVMAS